MTTENVSVISIIAAASVGIAGIVSGFLTARGQRLSAERLATQSFVQTRRGDAYGEILTVVRQLSQVIATGTDQEFKAIQGDWFHTGTLVSLYGSKDLRDAFARWATACRELSTARAEGPNQEGGGSDPTPEVREARDAVKAAEATLQTIARADIQTEA